MAEFYKIGTKLGYDLANGLKVGESVTATDGSVWTKQADGSISVLHNGQTMTGQITYQPTNQEAVKNMTGSSGYESPYAAQIQEAIAGLNNSQWEGWNKDQDESYQAYRKEYLREADRSMQDTLGQYAQNTGGIAGSSAIAAASQAADYYKAQLADKVPELYENAYNRYLNDLQTRQNNISLMMNAENQAQSGYYQQISYALSKWAQMGYADQEVANILGVTAGTPTSDQSYTDWSTAFQQDQFDYQKQQNAAAVYSGRGSTEESQEEAEQTDIDGMSEDEIVNWVKNMLDTATSSQFDGEKVIQGTSQLTKAQKEYALQVMWEFINSGYMKHPG